MAGKETGIIASLLTGFAVGLILLVLAVFLWKRHRKRQLNPRNQQPDTVQLGAGKEHGTSSGSTIVSIEAPPKHDRSKEASSTSTGPPIQVPDTQPALQPVLQPPPPPVYQPREPPAPAVPPPQTPRDSSAAFIAPPTMSYLEPEASSSVLLPDSTSLSAFATQNSNAPMLSSFGPNDSAVHHPSFFADDKADKGPALEDLALMAPRPIRGGSSTSSSGSDMSLNLKQPAHTPPPAPPTSALTFMESDMQLPSVLNKDGYRQSESGQPRSGASNRGSVASYRADGPPSARSAGPTTSAALKAQPSEPVAPAPPPPLIESLDPFANRAQDHLQQQSPRQQQPRAAVRSSSLASSTTSLTSSYPIRTAPSLVSNASQARQYQSSRLGGDATLPLTSTSSLASSMAPLHPLATPSDPLGGEPARQGATTLPVLPDGSSGGAGGKAPYVGPYSDLLGEQSMLAPTSLAGLADEAAGVGPSSGSAYRDASDSLFSDVLPGSGGPTGDLDRALMPPPSSRWPATPGQAGLQQVSAEAGVGEDLPPGAVIRGRDLVLDTAHLRFARHDSLMSGGTSHWDLDPSSGATGGVGGTTDLASEWNLSVRDSVAPEYRGPEQAFRSDAAADSVLNDSFSESGALSLWALDESAPMPVAPPPPAIAARARLPFHPDAGTSSSLVGRPGRTGSLLAGGGGDTTSVWNLSVRDDSEVGISTAAPRWVPDAEIAVPLRLRQMDTEPKSSLRQQHEKSNQPLRMRYSKDDSSLAPSAGLHSQRLSARQPVLTSLQEDEWHESNEQHSWQHRMDFVNTWVGGMSGQSRDEVIRRLQSQEQANKQ